MAFELTPLQPHELAPAVARVAGSGVVGPAKMMAARGLAPLSPSEMVTAMYQLSHDADNKVAQSAIQSAEKLPDNILTAALTHALDPRVLHFFSQRALDRPLVVEKILLNPHTHDETFVDLAGKLEEQELEILAVNQQRLLRYPAIIEALYFNPAARASTVDRVLELAVRNGIELAGIPQFKDLAAIILGQVSTDSAAVTDAALGETETADDGARAAADELFSTLLSDDSDDGTLGTLELEEKPKQTEDARNIGQLPVARKIRLATLGKAEHRAVLVRDSNRIVAMAAITSPKLTDREVMMYAGNRQVCEDVIRYIAERREWQKHYQVKVSLVNNPKCPLTHSMRLLNQLRASDLKSVARSKSIPSALAKAAKRLAR